MARMYPEEFPEDSPSEAERQVFVSLRDRLGPAYTVISQLAWLTPGSGGRPREGEADLLIVHPDWGLQVIEVKGGVVSADPTRGWTSNGRPIGNPVTQAQRAAHEVGRRLGAAPGTRSYSYPYGHGVWFPDVDAVSIPTRTDAPEAIVLDAADLEQPEAAIERLYGFWLADPLPPGPGPMGVEALVGLLAPTWNLRPLLGSAIAREGREQRRLSQQQFGVLKMLGRRPRALIAGCAGSGKTLLALEKARQLAASGFRVLFTCFNRNLAAAIQAQLASTGVHVVNFHELCYQLGTEAGVDLPELETPGVGDAYFTEQLPEALSRAATQLGGRYDAIVVDEGQDFQDLWWVPLTELLKDPEQGVLYIFFDDRQDIYRRPRAWPISDIPFELTTNCRTTQAIHRALQQTNPIGMADVDCIGPEGRPVERIELENEQAERDGLRRVVHGLVVEGRVALSDVVVLTPRSRLRSAWSEGTTLGNVRLTWNSSPAAGEIQVSTIHGFKGLEKPVVILTELAHLYRESVQELLYVGRSRATSHLIELWVR
jgi:hypothetical protein